MVLDINTGYIIMTFKRVHLSAAVKCHHWGAVLFTAKRFLICIFPHFISLSYSFIYTVNVFLMCEALYIPNHLALDVSTFVSD